MPVGDDADFFEGDKPFGDHLMEDGKEFGDAFGFVDDLNDEGQVFGETEDLGGVNSGRCAEPEDAFDNGSASHTAFAGFGDNGFVKRSTVVLVVFTDEDSEQFGFRWQLHV